MCLQDFHRTGENRDSALGGQHKQNNVCIKTQMKGAVIPQEAEPDLPASPGVSCGGVQQWMLATSTGALAAVLEEVPLRKSSWRWPSRLKQSL